MYFRPYLEVVIYNSHSHAYCKRGNITTGRKKVLSISVCEIFTKEGRLVTGKIIPGGRFVADSISKATPVLCYLRRRTSTCTVALYVQQWGTANLVFLDIHAKKCLGLI